MNRELTRQADHSASIVKLQNALELYTPIGVNLPTAAPNVRLEPQNGHGFATPETVVTTDHGRNTRRGCGNKQPPKTLGFHGDTPLNRLTALSARENID
jgi:hypothetical protein